MQRRNGRPEVLQHANHCQACDLWLQQNLCKGFASTTRGGNPSHSLVAFHRADNTNPVYACAFVCPANSASCSGPPLRFRCADSRASLVTLFMQSSPELARSHDPSSRTWAINNLLATAGVPDRASPIVSSDGRLAIMHGGI